MRLPQNPKEASAAKHKITRVPLQNCPSTRKNAIRNAKFNGTFFCFLFSGKSEQFSTRNTSPAASSKYAKGRRSRRRWRPPGVSKEPGGRGKGRSALLFLIASRDNVIRPRVSYSESRRYYEDERSRDAIAVIRFQPFVKETRRVFFFSSFVCLFVFFFFFF